MDWAKTTARQEEKHLSFGICWLILEVWQYNELQFVEINSNRRREHLDFNKSISWLLMAWWSQEPRHQQFGWPSLVGTTLGPTVMPQSHPATGPVRFLAPIRFLTRKAKWNARRNFTLMLFSGSHQATDPVRLETAVHLWFDRIIRRSPHGPRAMPVRASYGPRTVMSNVFHILQDSYVAQWDPYGHVRELTQIEFAKVPLGYCM